MPLNRPLSVSLVIVNKGDRGIVDTLDAVGAIMLDPPWSVETIVVDASGGRLNDIRDRHPGVRWIEFVGRADATTIANQRNIGVAQSRGDVVVFIDASCVPDPGWLRALISPIALDEESVVAGSHHSRGNRSIRDESAHFMGESRYIREAPTLNLAVARQVFDMIGGFDESFDYGSDIDFTWRAVDAGLRIRYVREASVGHDWGTHRAELRRSFRYGQARYRLYAKHPRRLRTAWRHDPEAVAYPLYLLIAPLSLVSPWIVMLIVIPLVKNVRHRPLLTVSHHLIHAAGILTEAVRSRVG